MSADMTVDVFAEHIFGKVAIEKISKLQGGLPENFRLYEAGWIGEVGKVMRISGAEFRVAKTGPNKGRLSIMIPKTTQTAYVTAEEMASYT